MQTITLALPYDFDNGDFPHEAIAALHELTELAGPHVTDTPRLRISTVLETEDWGEVRFNIETTQVDCRSDPFDWLVDATDEVMPMDATQGVIELVFSLEDDQAVLLKTAWPSHHPRLTVRAHE